MIRLAWANLRWQGSKMAAVLAAVAVAVGFMVSLTLVFTAAYEDIRLKTTGPLTGADLVIDQPRDAAQHSSTTGATTSASAWLDSLSQLPGLDNVELFRSAFGETEGHSVQIASVSQTPQRQWFELSEGRWPTGSNGVILEQDGARSLGVQVGDAITLNLDSGRSPQVEVVGVTDLKTGTSDPSLLRVYASAFFFDDSDEVFYAVADVSAGTNVVTAIEDAEQSGQWQAITADTACSLAMDDALGSSSQILGVAGAVVVVLLMVAALVISSSFRILLAQRRRADGLLRLVGGQRYQIVQRALLEGLIIGALGAALGLFVGVVGGIGAALRFGLPLFWSSLHLMVVLPVVAGVVISTVAAVTPARRSSRISPLVALDADTHATASVQSSQGSSLWTARVVPLPVRLAGMFLRTRLRRTLSTVVALSVVALCAVGLVTGAVTASSTVEQRLDERYPVDIALSDAAGVAESAVATLDRTPGVASVTVLEGVGGALTSDEDFPLTITQWDPDAAHLVRSLDSPALSGPGQAPAALISPGLAAVQGIDEGEEFTVTIDQQQYRLTAQVSNVALAASSAMLILPPGVLSMWDIQTRPVAVWAGVNDEASAAEVTAAVQRLADSLGVRLGGSLHERSQSRAVISTLLALGISVAVAAVIVAFLGLTNVLQLSVLERRRATGLLRALGLTQQGVRWMFVTESMMVAGTAALTGAVIGLPLAALSAGAVLGGQVQIVVPWLAVIGLVIGYLFAAAVAAWLPAYRMSRVEPAAVLSRS